MNDYLQALRATPEFQVVLKSIKAERPAVPLYNYQDDNTKEWQALSNKQQGFDLCYLILSGEEL